MTTNQIARLFRARPAGRGKWTAKCPSHRDRMPSLSIREGREGKTLVQCFAGCPLPAILDAVGLRMSDLFVDAKRAISTEVRQRLGDEERLRILERRHGLFIMLQAVEPGRKHYWSAAELNTSVEIRELRDKLYPSEKQHRDREFEVQRVIAEYGFDYLWECVP